MITQITDSWHYWFHICFQNSGSLALVADCRYQYFQGVFHYRFYNYGFDVILHWQVYVHVDSNKPLGLMIRGGSEFGLGIYITGVDPHSVAEFAGIKVGRRVHYSDIIMGAMASQITSLMIVYSIVYSGADLRKHQSSASLAFVRGIYQWPVNSPHKGPVTQKMFPFDDVIMRDPFHRDELILGHG